MASADEPDRTTWLTLKQAHERLKPLGISDQTVRGWGESGKIEMVKMDSGHRRFNPESVDAYLERELAKRRAAREARQAREAEAPPGEPSL